ncbi:hypothetical protein MBLNU13_g11647t1 [Cladosporium sp. NU13]
MHYQHLLLPALTGLVVVAKSNESLRDWGLPPSDELPVAELRYVPVLTHYVATGVANQDKSPPTIPANADEDSSTILKRTPSGIAHQPHKRAACDPLPTLPNTYNINLANAPSFRSDPAAASVAKNANPAPTGYYQTFKNLQGSSNAMNPLGTIVVNKTKGYDIDFCATRCNVQPGCLAFNIFFERNPTLDPGRNCLDPPAFANIKCTLWGAALDAKTATNRGSRTRQFDTAVAGSNGYNSYKLGGPIEGWKHRNLNASVMNTPLYDCTKTWTYLGYKLFQPASIDPRLCAAACDEHTAYDKAHPARGADDRVLAPVACNAFGSYILTKTNSTNGRTAEFQVGQMCTMYTNYWNETFAVNREAFDDAVGAKYTYSFSTFYGKVGAQPDCKGKV